VDTHTSPRTRSRPLLGLLFGVVGLLGLALAAFAPQFRILGLPLALVSFFAAASMLSLAARMASRLPDLAGKEVWIEVWGQALEPDSHLHVDSVRVLGAGLHFLLRSGPETPPKDLKIAQPKATTVDDSHLEISSAAYISWNGVKLKSSHGYQRPAAVISWRPP
jgi:hypothetical protein